MLLGLRRVVSTIHSLRSLLDHLPGRRPRSSYGRGFETLADARSSTTEAEPTGERERREPIKGARKMVGQAMVDSAFTAPHVTEWVTVDVTRTMEFVDRLKARREFRDVKVSPLLVLARAAMLAMRRTSEINSYWDEAAQKVVFKHYVNLGIAAAAGVTDFRPYSLGAAEADLVPDIFL